MQELIASSSGSEDKRHELASYDAYSHMVVIFSSKGDFTCTMIFVTSIT